jgi:hypothetical protein
MLLAEKHQLAGELASFAEQASNRWEGFDLRDPDGLATSLREQIVFSGIGLALAAIHPDSAETDRERYRNAVAQLIERLLQRRVWANWATHTERAGRQPDPIHEGYVEYSGSLALLLGFYRISGGDTRFDEPFILHWASDARFSYDHAGLIECLTQQMLAASDGAIANQEDALRPWAMATVLWALRCYDAIHGSNRADVGERWIKTLEQRVALQGPRVFGRGTLRGIYHPQRKRGSFSGDPLNDAWTLALTAGPAPTVISKLAERHWLALRRSPAGDLYLPGDPAWHILPTAFSYLLAVELADHERAAALAPAFNRHLTSISENPEAAAAKTWVQALALIGASGGMSRVLQLPPPPPPPAVPSAPAPETS